MTRRSVMSPTIKRGVDTFAQLVARLREKRFGCYLVWIHEGRVAKVPPQVRV